MPVTEIRKVADEQAVEVGPYLRGAKRIVISPNANLNFISLGIPYLEEIYGCLAPLYLRPVGGRLSQPEVDTVIFRKNDFALTGDCPETVALIKTWQNDATSSFRLVKETNYLLVFRRKKSPTLVN